MTGDAPGLTSAPCLSACLRTSRQRWRGRGAAKLMLMRRIRDGMRDPGPAGTLHATAVISAQRSAIHFHVDVPERTRTARRAAAAIGCLARGGAVAVPAGALRPHALNAATTLSVRHV